MNRGISQIGVSLLAVSYVLAVTGLGTLLAVFVRTSAQAGAFAVLVSMVTSMIFGSWVTHRNYFCIHAEYSPIYSTVLGH